MERGAHDLDRRLRAERRSLSHPREPQSSIDVCVAVVAGATALTPLSLQAQGQAPDTGNLRVEKDVVFGKGGSKDLTLDVYRPPAGVADVAPRLQEAAARALQPRIQRCRCARAESSRAIKPACRALLTSKAMFAARVAPPVRSATRWSRNGVTALPRMPLASASLVAC